MVCFFEYVKLFWERVIKPRHTWYLKCLQAVVSKSLNHVIQTLFSALCRNAGFTIETQLKGCFYFKILALFSQTVKIIRFQNTRMINQDNKKRDLSFFFFLYLIITFVRQLNKGKCVSLCEREKCNEMCRHLIWVSCP